MNPTHLKCFYWNKQENYLIKKVVRWQSRLIFSLQLKLIYNSIEMLIKDKPFLFFLGFSKLNYTDDAKFCMSNTQTMVKRYKQQ